MLEIEYILSKEKRYIIKDYMMSQKGLKENVRTIVVDWLIGVAELYNLDSEAVFLATNYMDRFMCINQVTSKDIQLIAVTCLFVASYPIYV